MNLDRVWDVIRKLDQLNSEDPNKIDIKGTPRPYELYYAERLTDWILKLEPKPSESLQIAARGQHVQRWKIPRTSYEMTRGGYLRWREDLKRFHADTVAKVMRESGYEAETVEKTKAIILKKNRAGDRETQIIEDALCLIFLELQFSDLMKKTEPAKMKEIIQKTWKKMSGDAQNKALELRLTKTEKQFITDALR